MSSQVTGKKDRVVPIYKGGDRALVGIYTQTCQPKLGGLQTNGAGYIRVTKTSLGIEWVQGQHGFSSGDS
jgi:hypothetical protein